MELTCDRNAKISTGNESLYLFLLTYVWLAMHVTQNWVYLFTLGDKSISLVRLCLQVKTFRFVTICLSRQVLTSVFELAVSCTLIARLDEISDSILFIQIH